MSTARKSIDHTLSASDAFLSAAFGYPCRYATLPLDAQTLRTELEAMPAPGFMWIKVPGRADPAFGALHDLGFVVAVEEISYVRPADLPAPAIAEADGFSIRKISRSEADQFVGLADALGALAAGSLTTSRFHLDPEISNDIAARVKQRWAMNFFKGLRGHEMIIATAADGRIAGFNQVLAGAEDKVIDLICTADDFRRRGVARALVAAMVEPGKTLRVGSQANNDAADAFYKSLGFRPVGTSLCLHWHAGKENTP